MTLRDRLRNLFRRQPVPTPEPPAALSPAEVQRDHAQPTPTNRADKELARFQRTARRLGIQPYEED